MRRFDKEENWQALAGGYRKGWSGWRGLWGFYNAEGKQTKAWTGARMFHHDGDGTYKQVQVHSDDVGAATGRKRDDGGYEKSWEFNKAEACRADGWWHPAVKEDGLLRSRILGISPARTATVCFALPLKEYLLQDETPIPTKFWNLELCVRPQESDRSYSCGAGYNIAEGTFETLVYIREAKSSRDPADEEALHSHPIRRSSHRKGLADDLRIWAGTRGDKDSRLLRWQALHGVTQQLVFNEDGGIAVSAEEATAWTPPCSSLRATVLPDAMYMACPEALPTTLADVPAEGVTFEFGGVRPTVPYDESYWGTGFSRTVLHYGPSGRIASLRFDDFDLDPNLLDLPEHNGPRATGH